MADYSQQGRTDAAAYARYLAGMDASMRQKVALTAAHLHARGKVADMGCGSGAGADALAALYPALEVVGVDVDPTMVELARERFARPNLSYVVGDIAAPVFEDRTLDGVLDSSVLHHVTTFGGYDHAAAGRCLEVQARALRVHGALVVRDFLAPDDDREVWLDVPADDGDGSRDPRRASTAALLERFASEFRILDAAPGFPLGCEGEVRPGWRRYRLRRRHAVEFVLRKDYRADWESEVKEEYTYFTQRDFEECFARLGLRVLASTPLYNPWILRRRFEGRLQLRDAESGATLGWPPTNYVIVGEKVAAGEGVRFRDAGDAPPLGFLELECHRDRRTGAVRDLVRRPHATLDVLPFFTAGDEVFVLARTSYPRPLLASREACAPSLCGSRAPHYVAEPLTMVMSDRPLGDAIEGLLARAGVEAREIVAVEAGATYYPSPGGTLEEVRSVRVEIEPILAREPALAPSGFSTSGHLRAIEARQLLRAAQVGGLPDARLEMDVLALLHARRLDPGPWIGEALDLRDAPAPPPPSARTALRALARRPPRRAFERAGVEASPGFLARRSAHFEELDAEGRALTRKALEMVVPRARSSRTIATAVLWRHGDEVFIGLDDDDLPAAQCFAGQSQLLVAPAWRLPASVDDQWAARDFARERLRTEYGLRCGAVFELGGRYFPSAGLSPEVVYPLAVEVTAVETAPRALAFVPLCELPERLGDLVDGHLRIVGLRAALALGCFARAPR